MVRKSWSWIHRDTTKEKFKKAGKIALDVLLYTFIAVGLMCIVLTVVSKKDPDGTATVFGYQMRRIETPSMAENDEFDQTVGYDNVEIDDLPVNTMVFIEVVPTDAAEAKAWYDELEIYDVLTFKYVIAGKQIVITHRLIDKQPNPNGGWTLSLQGDNKAEDTMASIQTIDTSNPEATNYVIGKVTGDFYLLGLVITSLQKPIGLVLMIIIPCAIIVVIEAIRIYNVLNAEKKKKLEEQAKQQEEQAKQQRDEIEELKRKLAMLESNDVANNSDNKQED